MNINRNLILIKGEDKTEQIATWSYDSGRIIVTYNDGRTYAYAHTNVAFYKEPVEIDPAQHIVLKNEQQLFGLIKIQRFQKHYRLIYKNDYSEVVNTGDINLIKSVLDDKHSKTIWDYFKKVAAAVGLKAEDGRNILESHYNKIDFIREDSILAAYLSGKLPQCLKEFEKTSIYPFGFNASQKIAVDNALNNPLSIIEGPPGTGKTQTILNIIANAIMRNESVAIVSSNNSATMNVFEKLKKNQIDFIAANLGSLKNKEAFIESQNGAFPDMTSWALAADKERDIKHSLQVMGEELDSMLSAKNELSFIIQQYDALLLEQGHFLKYFDGLNYNVELRFLNRLRSSAILKLWAESEEIPNAQKYILLRKLLSFFRYGVGSSFYKLPIETRIALCQKAYYQAVAAELKKQKSALEAKLIGYGFDNKMVEYAELSMQLFKSFLCKKYKTRERKKYTQDDLYKNAAAFICDYPVILSTTYSLRSSLASQHIYDYVIMDEASQVNLATGALAFSCAKKAVIVGDIKQLPNVINTTDEKQTDEIFNAFDISDNYQYSKHSILSSVSQIFTNLPKTMLREHYRCNPKIIEFCNQKFYDGRLIILTKSESTKHPLLVYKTVAGNHARGHYNQRQIDVIKNEVIKEQNIDIYSGTLGIVTPYDAQRNALQEQFKDTAVMADTVDKFQGQERKTIIITTVDNEISEFTDNPNRLNVAVSRAQEQLIVVTGGNSEEKDSNVRDLINYIRYNNLEIIQSNIYSVFDYLYTAYAKERIAQLKKRERISEYDSENLMYGLIKDVLDTDEFSMYSVVAHVPLKMLLRDVALMNDEEVRYAMNDWTHVDFLIFNKLSKQPVLVIEVDGFAFHQTGSEQAERDLKKNGILGKYGLPYIRFKTNESSEKERLIEKLKNSDEYMGISV